MKQTWTQITKNYPNMQVVLGDVEENGSFIACANVIDYCYDEEIKKLREKYRKEHKDKKVWIIRTSDSSLSYNISAINYNCATN